jgi:predicted PurR-regulated permease PerM
MTMSTLSEIRRDTKVPALSLIVGTVVIVAALRAAGDIFIPLAVAMLLSFLLAPLVRRFSRWRLPNVVAVLATVGIAFSVLGFVTWLVSVQFVNLVDELPKYQENLRAKITSLTQSRDTVFSRAEAMIGSLQRDLEEETARSKPPADLDEPPPVQVEVRTPETGPFTMLTRYGSPLLGPIGVAAISFIFVVFFLLQRNDLRDRFIKLVSGGDINMATQAVDDATQRITRYLLMQMVINVTYGIPLAIGLYFIGVPNAMLWGILATLLRFIPFLGPWIAAVFPISLAIAVDPGWTMPLLAIGLVVLLELISNNVIEPWLYGSSTGISIVALIFAALVWTWIWGPIGLFLSTPLTVCLLVMGKNVRSLSFLNVILGSEPVLAPEAQLYQRMLALDPESVLDQADRYLASESLANYYDRVLVPALALAERDRHAGALAERRQQFIIQATRELIEELGAREPKEPNFSSLGRVLCVPARDEADELTALMLTQLLRQAGFRAETVELTKTSSAVIERIQELRPMAVCLCAIPPGAISSTRRICRILREANVPFTMTAGVWGTLESATAVRDRLATACPDLVATSFTDTLVQIANIAPPTPEAPASAQPGPDDETARLEVLKRLHILDTPPEEMYDSITRQLADTFDVPISLISLVDADRQFWKTQVSLPDDLDEAREVPRNTSLCGQVVGHNELLVVEDLTLDPRFADNPFVKDRGIRFYAGVPLRTSTGHAVGSLCILDTKPKTVTEEQKWLLQVLADELMRSAEQHQVVAPVAEQAADEAPSNR